MTSPYDVDQGVATLSIIDVVNATAGPLDQPLSGRQAVREQSTAQRTVRIPAEYVEVPPAVGFPPALMSMETARANGMTSGAAARLMADTTRMPTSGEEDRARDALARAGVQGDVDVERGYQSRFTTALLVMAVTTGVLALMATGIAVGLALADGSADQGTLSAIGAGPRVRRFTSAFQALVISTLGVVLGFVAGIIPGAGLAWIARYRHVAGPVYIHRSVPWGDVVPWMAVIVVVVGVPVVATIFAWLLTRSGVRMAQRAQ